MARFLELGTSTNPDTGEIVNHPFLKLDDGTRVRILDKLDDLKAYGKPADVLKALITGTHAEYGMYAYLPKRTYAPLAW